MTAGDVMAALGTVYDPELDEPITALRFVAACEVGEAGAVSIRLRLPTPQCAPNFAFLMAADAAAAVRALPGAGPVRVVLDDHYTAAEINSAVGRGEEFAEAFPGETEGRLDTLRELFRRKALLARQARACEALLAQGAAPTEIAAMRLGELPDSPDARRCRELRAQLGIAAAEGAPGFVRPDGSPVTADGLATWLRMAGLVRTSLEANGGICRSLLTVRYGIPESEEAAA